MTVLQVYPWLLVVIKAVMNLGSKEFYPLFPELQDLPFQICLADCRIRAMKHNFPQNPIMQLPADSEGSVLHCAAREQAAPLLLRYHFHRHPGI